MTGYAYKGSDWVARTPRGILRPFLGKLEALQGEMEREGTGVWKQCLIQITRPDCEIKMMFEYDDPARWSLKQVSLDLGDYANALRPPAR